MTQSVPQRPPRDALKIKFGDRFEAHATGWGVAAVPLVVLVIAGLTLARVLLF